MVELKLINYRISKGLTQSQLAKKVDISTRNYQRIEAGEREPKVRTAIKMAKALDTTVEELFPEFSVVETE